MMLKRFCLVLLAATAAPALAFGQQQDFSKVQIKTEKVSGTTYMMTGAGGNLGLFVGDDAVFLIDDQFAPLTPKIKAAIKRLTKKPIKFVFNTHWHADHTGGNENLGKGGALIVAHDNVRKRMSSEQFVALMGRKVPPSPKAALPVVTFAADVTFHINGDTVHAIHMPNAHTDGDSVVFFEKSNVIHMGDIYFNGAYPFIDLSSGGSIDGTIAALDRVLGMIADDTKVIPGHGPLSTKAELQAYRDMLAAITGSIKAQLKAGKTLEQIIAAKPTARFDDKWGKGFIQPDKFVETIVKSLRR